MKIGKSLAEPDPFPSAARCCRRWRRSDGTPLPKDVVVAKEFKRRRAGDRARRGDDVRDDEMILDIGPQTALELARVINSAGTIIWNGPIGVFRVRDAFANGTHQMALAIAEATARALRSPAAATRWRPSPSTTSAGGSATSRLAAALFPGVPRGKTLPAIEVLQQRAAG